MMDLTAFRLVFWDAGCVVVEGSSGAGDGEASGGGGEVSGAGAGTGVDVVCLVGGGTFGAGLEGGASELRFDRG